MRLENVEKTFCEKSLDREVNESGAGRLDQRLRGELGQFAIGFCEAERYGDEQHECDEGHERDVKVESVIVVFGKVKCLFVPVTKKGFALPDL